VLNVITLVDAETSRDHTLTIHPNPSSGRFVVDTEESATVNYVVQDCTGRPVAKGLLSPGSNPVALNVASGVYFMRFANGVVKRLVVR
jgi:hypothetical protein